MGTTTGIGALQDRAILVDLTTNMWGGRRTDRIATRAVSEKFGSDERMGKYRKALVLPEHLEPIEKVGRAAAVEHRRRTLPWLDSGFRILSSDGFLPYTETMRHFETEWNDAVGHFVAHYGEHVNEARIALNGLFDPSEYPSSATIATRFSFGTNYAGIETSWNGGDDFRVKLGQYEVDRIRAKVEEQAKAAVAGAMEDVIKRIHEAVGHMAESLKSYHVTGNGKVENAFRDTLVGNIRALVDLLPSLNITQNAAIAAITERMREGLLQYTAQTLRDNQRAREETAAAAESILNEMGAFFA